ncbi:MAG: FHA domain-containing protein [Halobacteriovoraceae bacterium]|nr:FHA domain-containing protein [Halobacteriovoraceae bacterium]
MFKLIIVGGKNRGKEFDLSEGDNIVGRDESCDIHIPVTGISKKHFNLTLMDGVFYFQDLESSNGTFVNGKITKKAIVHPGDKLAVPDVIMKIVRVKEVQLGVSSQEEDEEEKFLKGGPAPTSLVPRLMHHFKYRLMPVFHGINEEYEWRVLLGIILFVFILSTITLTIFPVLKDSRQLLLYEIARRGAHYADQIGRLNARALSQKQLDRVDSRFLDNEEGVTSYELFDTEGRIVRPLSKLNEYIVDSFSILSRDWALNNPHSNEAVLKKILSDGEIGVAKKIMAYDVKTGVEIAVGIIAIRFAPKSLAIEAAKNSKAFFEALTTSAIIAMIFFGVIYYLTLKPLEEMRFHIEQTLKGKKKGIESRYLMSEIGPLKNSINSILQSIRELQSNGEEMDNLDMEEDIAYVNTLKEFIKGAGGPSIILNSEKKIEAINTQAEDLTGMRENAAQGEELLEVAREQGFSATVVELCDRSANENGSCQEGEYELSGKQYSIFVNSLMGRDNFVKAFYITFVSMD